MLLPFYGVPETIAQALERHREVFFREEGFAHVSRYITGLVLSPNKTLQGIYNAQAWGGEKPSRRAMHEAVLRRDGTPRSSWRDIERPWQKITGAEDER